MGMTHVAAGETIPAEPRSTTAARWALASLSLSMLLSSLGTSIANVGLPAMADAFDASFQAVQWIVLAYLLCVTSLVVGAGHLGDMVGRRRLLLAGIAVFTGASVLCGLAPNLPVLIAARAVQGLGAAFMMALTMAMVSDAVPKARTGAAMGLLGTMSAVGTALGPSLGGALVVTFGWRALFLAAVPLGIAALFLGQRFLPADRPRNGIPGAGFDHAGTVVLGLVLVGYALAMTIGRGEFGAVSVALLAGAGCGIGVFIAIEIRAEAPLIRLAMLRDAALNSGLVSNLLVSTVMMTTLVVGPFHLSCALGLDPARVGLVLATGPVMAALAGVPSGRIADRIGASLAAIAGLVGMVAACLAFALMPMAAGIAGYVVPLALLTASYALFQTANNTAVMTGVNPERKGVVSGMLNLSRNLGLVTGASAMGAIFARATAAVDIATARPEAVAAGTAVAFAVSAFLIAAALATALASRTLARPTPVQSHRP